MELNKLLKVLGIASSGAEAKMLIRGGKVFRSGKVETRIRAKLKVADTIEVNGNKIRIL